MQTTNLPTTNPNWRQEAIPLRQYRLETPTKGLVIGHASDISQPSRTDAPDAPDDAAIRATKLVRQDENHHDKVTKSPNSVKETPEQKPLQAQKHDQVQDNVIGDESATRAKKPDNSLESKSQGDLLPNCPCNKRRLRPAHKSPKMPANRPHRVSIPPHKIMRHKSTTLVKIPLHKILLHKIPCFAPDGETRQDHTTKAVWADKPFGQIKKVRPIFRSSIPQTAEHCSKTNHKMVRILTSRIKIRPLPIC